MSSMESMVTNGVAKQNGHGESWKAPEKAGVKRSESIYSNEASKSRYEAYSRLQASAVAFGEKLPIPEIVAVGGQSDGKSSLLEALLGFRFNVKEVEMGTRRPLMLQMIHDPEALEPRCRLQDEDADDYGPVITPVSSVADHIRIRTEGFLKKLGTAVSAKPIVMRAEYAYCPNLTIIDTPGFILKAKKGEPDSTPDEIEAMVRELAAPQHRLLLFLQQSSVEWCSSLWLDVVKSIDPSLQRTMVVVSKFDNRLKEFTERWEVDRYLSTGGYLGENARPFFVALPKDRGTTTNDDYRHQISVVDIDILKQLRENVAGGFDEERFGNYVGFGKLRQFLEAELQRRYRDAAPETMLLLNHRCLEVQSELAIVEAKIKASADVTSLRKLAMKHAWLMASNMVELLDGVDSPDPSKWGRTSEEERSESGLVRWPGQAVDIVPCNAKLKLHGRAAFNRVLHEYKCVACSIEWPPVSEERVASILQARGGPVFDLAQSSARSLLGPLLDTICDRLVFILRNLYKLAAERMRIQQCSRESTFKDSQDLSAYVAFHLTLRDAHERFIRKVAARSKDLLNQHLSAIIKSFSNDFCGNDPYMYSSWKTGKTAGGMRSSTVKFPTADMEDQTVYKRESADDDEVTDAPDKKRARNALGGVQVTGDLRESQIAVPETPTPEQIAAEAKRKEFARASGRISAIEDTAQTLPDAGVVAKKSRKSRRRISIGRDLKTVVMQTTGNGTSSVHREICEMAAETFGKIRQLLVERTVDTLNEAFLDPFRTEQAIDVLMEVFGVTDDKFLEMFVAPGAIEKLEREHAILQKRSMTLLTCLHEFRTLAHSL
ncbi:hypothetical protein KC19_1G056300 [Ceratodon purpureus]|uniref:Dynamin-type G domain-containing protein n=1 Tax=Ceratodon purpureus TaxID=3225 RepID=A0A8T0J1U5_CERPU|nr:hypothetical protein KC19_1G056300 [Ceratodon purpureus]